MALTIDCGEGKHDVCSGSGTDVYLFPQESGKRFTCACRCHTKSGRLGSVGVAREPREQ